MLEEFPGISVAFHHDEAPFMLEGANYAKVPADNLPYKILRGLVPKDNLTATLKHAFFLQVKPIGCLVLGSSAYTLEYSANCKGPAFAIKWHTKP